MQRRRSPEVKAEPAARSSPAAISFAEARHGRASARGQWLATAPSFRLLLLIGVILLPIVVLMQNTDSILDTSAAGLGFDFRGDLLIAGHAILHGTTPYDISALDAKVRILQAGGTIGWVASPRYPPPILLAALPFTLLPATVATILFILLSAAGAVVGLRLLGVRDWRCIAVALASAPTAFGLWLGNLSPLLLLAAGLAWYWRSHLRAVAIVVASAVAAKLIMWPLLVWLLATRRFRSFFLASAVLVVAVLGTWAAIGFADLLPYPHLLADVAYIGEGRGSSLVSLLLSAGLSLDVARAAALAGAGALLLGAWLTGRGPDGDRSAFSLAVMAALTATPVVWLHYLVLLFVPIALFSPRLSPVWFLPMLATWSPAKDLAIEVVVVAWILASQSWRDPIRSASRSAAALVPRSASIRERA